MARLEAQRDTHSALRLPANIYLFKVNSKTLEEVVKFKFQIWQQRCQNEVIDVVLVSLLLTLNILRTFF